MPHEEVFKWLDDIDIYIQPSDTEGLSRALIEAMSRGCPCIASNAGGNIELINKEYIFKKKNVRELINCIINIFPKEKMMKESKTNYIKSKQFTKELLNTKRIKFYENLMR